MKYYFNPSSGNYAQLIELFEKLGIDHDISWDDAHEDGSYIYDIVITARKVGKNEHDDL